MHSPQLLFELVIQAEMYEREIGAQSCIWDYSERTLHLEPEDGEQEPKFHGPVYTVDYREVDDDDDRKDP